MPRFVIVVSRIFRSLPFSFRNPRVSPLTTQPQALRKKVVLGTASVVAALAVVVFLGRSNQGPEFQKNGIPVPFLSQGSALQGQVSFMGKRNGIDVYEVTYRSAEKFETLLPDRIYLVHVPNNLSEILDVPLDVAMVSAIDGGRSVDYYGYRYTDAAATIERKYYSAILFKDRFPGAFFASKKARDDDAKHGNQLQAFELQNNVTFRKTDGSDAQVKIDPLGALYVFVVNDPNGAKLYARPGGVCGNGVLEPGEECDDLNTVDTDSCSNLCTFNIPIPFGSGTLATGTKLAISVTNVAASGMAVRGQTGVTLMRFDAGGPEATRLNRIVVKADTGSLQNATSYELVADTNHDAHVDTVVSTGTIQNGLLIFDAIGGLQGYALAANSVTTFEVRATIAESPVSSRIQIGLAVAQSDYVVGRRESPAVLLAGIRLDGTCSLPACQIAVTNRASTEWLILAPAVCGNGTREGSEACDDGNTTASDGCSATCTVESGYTCNTATPNVCTSGGGAVCGNGIREAGEECDDGNQIDTDDCSNTCELTTPTPNF